MSNSSPYFSIVIPTYNRGHLIGQTIHSVLQQRFTDFELIIVDDGSKDDTELVVLAISDSRIKYYKKENSERGAARNYGRERSSGKYVNFFDSDDLMYPNHLEAAKKFVEEHQSPEFFHLGYDFKTVDGTVTKKVNQLNEQTPGKILFDNFLSCNGVFVRSDIAKEFPFEENRVLASAEDWELWVRLISRFKLKISNEITTSVVGHDQRSIRTISTERIVKRDLFLMEKLSTDPVVVKRYGNSLRRFIGERYTFFMLCFAEDKETLQVIRWAMKAIATYPGIVRTKRFWASIKNSVML